MEGIRQLAVVDEAQVDVHFAAQHHTGFRLALASDSLDGGLAGKNVHDLAPGLVTGGVVNTGYHIDVTYRLATAAQAARHLQAHNLRHGSQYTLNPLRFLFRDRIEETTRALLRQGKALQDLILGFLAKAW